MFEMGERGLAEVADPARAFLADHDAPAPGSVVAPVLEGSRPILVEVQALVAPTGAPSPRRTASGVDPNRLALLVAVLGRRAGIGLSSHDVYANLAGGLTVSEPGLDLPLALALASSLRDRPLVTGTVAIGEVGLLGELRSVGGLDRRLREAARLGFTRALVPRPRGREIPVIPGMDVVVVGTLGDAVRAALVGGSGRPVGPAPDLRGPCGAPGVRARLGPPVQRRRPRRCARHGPTIEETRVSNDPGPRRCARSLHRARARGHRDRAVHRRRVRRVHPCGMDDQLDGRRLRRAPVPHDRAGRLAHQARPGAVHRRVRDRRPRAVRRPPAGPPARPPARPDRGSARDMAAARDLAVPGARDDGPHGGQALRPDRRRGGRRPHPPAARGRRGPG